ncbi:MAG: DUF4230 domain-containing protein [Oscillospiraceae bacterium]|nr:DUF4230 domain-containing protein [Oscillospiraceae bacterium]
MVTDKKKTKLLMVLIALVLLTIAVLLIVYAVRSAGRPKTPVTVSPRPAQEVVVREKEVEKIVTVEKEISSAMLTDGVRELGLLVTEEYYFTEVVSYSSVKKLWKLDLPFTESSYLVSYDGVVRAGVDLSGASIVKDDEAKLITVTLPEAVITDIDIDPESFKLYSEKAGLGNPISAADFNNSLIELENGAREKALDRDVLTRADDNARTLVYNVVGTLCDLSEYRLVFGHTEG